jgi:[ribosomal protein S5]-alanine N-acetyltransferase
MRMLSLQPPVLSDADELLAFETRNRDFFERNINARTPSFYSESGVKQAIADAVRDAENDAAYQYLVRDSSGTLVGRVNLTRVRRAHFHSAEVGYRFAEDSGGKGHATEAVRQVIERAFGEHRLRRLEATARPENEGSVKVLTRNGFSEFGRSVQSFELTGRWYDLLHFELRADAI